MRGQIYSKFFAGNDIESLEPLLDEPWSLDYDLGRGTGWSVEGSGGSCTRFPTNQAYQRNIGVDIDSVAFLRTTEGWIPEAEGGPIRAFLGGFLDRNAACQDSIHLFQPFLYARQFTIALDRVNLFSDGFEDGTISRWN